MLPWRGLCQDWTIWARLAHVERRRRVQVPWRSRPARRSQRLLLAAGIDRRSAGDSTEVGVCRDVAYRVGHRDSANLGPVLAVAEELLGDEAHYGFVMAFLEDLQNLVSHRIETLRGPVDITRRLGPRCAVCWSTLAEFWASVAGWCSQAGISLESSQKMLAVHNEELRALLWTASRSLPSGETVDLAHVVLYEKAGGAPIPGYSHIATAMKITGQG